MPGLFVFCLKKKYLLSNQRGGSVEVNSSHDTARGQICCIGETRSNKYAGSCWWARYGYNPSQMFRSLKTIDYV